MAQGVFDKAAGLADTAAVTLNKVNAMLDTQLIADLRKTLMATNKLITHFADEKNGPTAQLNPTMVSLQQTSAQLDTTIASLDVKKLQFAPRFDDAIRRHARPTRLTMMTAHADSLMAKIQRGDGTIGKFMNDTTFYSDLRKTMQAMTDLLDEIKEESRQDRRHRPGAVLRMPRVSDIAALVREILVELGEDPDRQGLQRTPDRVEKSLRFLTQGYEQSAAKVIGDALFHETHNNMVVVRDIEFYSLCEHHMLPFFGSM